MDEHTTPREVAERFRLTPDEDLLLTSWQYRMMQRDVAASTGKSLAAKRPQRNDFRNRVLEVIEQSSTEDFLSAQTRQLSSTIRNDRTGTRSLGFQAMETSAADLTDVAKDRSRAMLLLIDLYGFEPWVGTSWAKPVRQKVLEEFRDTLAPLRDEDLDAVSNAYQTSLKALSTKNRRWGRIALFGAAGLGLGVLTAGVATPAIGALYGSAVLGYSGAVAANAGLAALGGGSLAAGGLGMAGGTALIAGVGGVAGMGVMSVGAHSAGLTARQVAADVIRLEVATQIVLRDVEGDEQAAKAVVLALREKMLVLRTQIVDLAARIETLRAERDQAIAEAKEERKINAEQEQIIAGLRQQLTNRLNRNTDDSDLTTVETLKDELEELEEQKRVNTVVSNFIAARADFLESRQ